MDAPTDSSSGRPRRDFPPFFDRDILPLGARGHVQLCSIFIGHRRHDLLVPLKLGPLPRNRGEQRPAQWVSGHFHRRPIDESEVFVGEYPRLNEETPQRVDVDLLDLDLASWGTHLNSIHVFRSCDIRLAGRGRSRTKSESIPTFGMAANTLTSGACRRRRPNFAPPFAFVSRDPQCGQNEIATPPPPALGAMTVNQPRRLGHHS